jgi:dynein light intermediate chain 1
MVINSDWHRTRARTQTRTHNAAGVLIIAVRTKADLVDDNIGLVGSGASGMGGMVKGKGKW